MSLLLENLNTKIDNLSYKIDLYLCKIADIIL